MANVTDPLAAAVHGTDPQNLMEYITRQKIYESRFWKEECFGLTAADVLEKAATTLKCVGASFGGNSQPTKFLSLVLKLLQLQPPPELIESTFIEQEDLKYVRALGAMYQRLTGRPAAIYETLEPIYRDYRKLRYRHPNEWKLTTMDQFIHCLLHDDRVCGIALPRLAARKTLVEEGYLENDQYQSPILQALGNKSLEEYLYQKVLDSSPSAKIVWQHRGALRKEKEAEQERMDEALRFAKEPRSHRDGRQQPKQDHSYYSRDAGQDEGNRRRDKGNPSKSSDDMKLPTNNDGDVDMTRQEEQRGDPLDQILPLNNGADPNNDEGTAPEAKRARKEKKKKNKDRGYGSLFKSSSSKKPKDDAGPRQESKKVDENSDEYWNEERAKLGLKPLRK